MVHPARDDTNGICAIRRNMSDIKSALESINVSALSYQEWVNVGMALKTEGLPCSMWDEWSRGDKQRYKVGECERKWGSFSGSSNPVTAATIFNMARENGWRIETSGKPMNWDDEILDDRSDFHAKVTEQRPVDELITYLDVLFKASDIVGYCTNDVWQDSDGDWNPGRGVFDRTKEEIIASLKKHPDDIGATIGDWRPECGAWIRFNPVDGGGVKNDNVTRFDFALVESDTQSVDEQIAAYKRLELPIAALVYSGRRSVHAIVRVDAKSYGEYQERVRALYTFLKKNGIIVDTQNKNPSRLSRMPGVTRNGKRQTLLDTNIGRASWQDWMDFVEGAEDDFPPFIKLSKFKDDPPDQPEEIIKGILRRGHKMLISGSSKAGKSFLLIELCIAVAEGIKWLTFPCRKGRVLYVNLEIDPASCIHRFLDIYKANDYPMAHTEDIEIWNLRGRAVPLDQLVPKMIRRVKEQGFDAIVIDPIYKVITGDENNASEMGAFCNQFDKIATETGCAVIYCHHHSKGAQGAKKAMDRASGSGVFARDPDAQLDMIELELSDDIKNNVRDGGATAWRMESSLREFANITPVNFWFEYPVHRVDTNGVLSKLGAEGSPAGNLAKSSKYTTKDERDGSIYTAYEACSVNKPVLVTDMASYLGVTPRCVRDRLKDLSDQFWFKNGTVGLMDEP